MPLPTQTGWHVETASVSTTNDGLQVEGKNFDATDDIDRRFLWNIGEWSVSDPRYDFSACTFRPGAEERLSQLRARAARRSAS